ncbi:hypothetical protein [Janthinobacterium lividum]|uniref:hypothetical protein n=1 Tax=Janthinobacterium lividum TaxID=29581 RepID=UPI001408105D|nr:hypothetical protein [Janthinobacterium lividum]NHQ92307.1 hypothetical protein [Janthinobacterium lividum]
MEITFRKPNSKKTVLQRLVIVILYYAFCLPGMYLMIVGLATGGVPIVMKLIWIGAWVAHIVMGIQWVRNVRLSPLWPIAGVGAGVASFLVIIILPIAMFIQLLLVLPGVLLACKLVAFHWAAPPLAITLRNE